MSTYVLFFGGYQASIQDVNNWRISAMKQSPGVAFDAYPYPDGASSKGEVAINKFKDNKTHGYGEAIKKLEEKIKDPKIDKIYIVGHSSGCAIANDVDACVKDHTKITLVALDGYCPGTAQLARPGTEVWTAKSSTGTSLHYQDLLDQVKDYDLKNKDWVQVNIYKATPDCSTQLALHFSLVNVSSSDLLVKHIPEGYKECQANLCWM